MKTAFFITDCSAGSASLLRQWLATQTDEAIRLTIVYPYDVEEGQPLTQNTLRPAKEAAKTALKNWSAALAWNGHLVPETVLANPELALTIYLLLRSYTYWLVDDHTRIAHFADLLDKTTTHPCWLAEPVIHRNYELAA